MSRTGYHRLEFRRAALVVGSLHRQRPVAFLWYTASGHRRPYFGMKGLEECVDTVCYWRETEWREKERETGRERQRERETVNC